MGLAGLVGWIAGWNALTQSPLGEGRMTLTSAIAIIALAGVGLTGRSWVGAGCRGVSLIAAGLGVAELARIPGAALGPLTGVEAASAGQVSGATVAAVLALSIAGLGQLPSKARRRLAWFVLALSALTLVELVGPMGESPLDAPVIMCVKSSAAFTLLALSTLLAAPRGSGPMPYVGAARATMLGLRDPRGQMPAGRRSLALTEAQSNLRTAEHRVGELEAGQRAALSAQDDVLQAMFASGMVLATALVSVPENSHVAGSLERAIATVDEGIRKIRVVVEHLSKLLGSATPTP